MPTEPTNKLSKELSDLLRNKILPRLTGKQAEGEFEKIQIDLYEKLPDYNEIPDEKLMFDETMKLFDNANDIQEVTTNKTIQEVTTNKTTNTSSNETIEKVNIDTSKTNVNKPPLYIGIDLESNRNTINLLITSSIIHLSNQFSNDTELLSGTNNILS